MSEYGMGESDDCVGCVGYDRLGKMMVDRC